MRTNTRTTASFPTARIPSRSGGLPVEVTLIAQLGPGAGDALCHDATARQRGHENFADALDEPSATLAGTDIERGEQTALHSFAVGASGHPFHRHAGHRVFTAVSGSGGAQLRFCTASDAQLAASPRAFVEALQYVNVPPDTMFTVRFGGGTWHQFAPLLGDASHPTLFALSCHTNELGGLDDPALLAQVRDGSARIHHLTELLPAPVLEHLRAQPLRHEDVPALTLTLNERPGGALNRACAAFRRFTGRMRGLASAACRNHLTGFVARSGRTVRELPRAADDSLLARQFPERFEHEDTFVLVLHGAATSGPSASSLLANVLEGFLENRPTGVSFLMGLRNLLVTPLRLRTSPLGCPASSLLSRDRRQLFVGRYPVLDQAIDSRDRAEVLLGADDRHLRFRSSVGVRFIGDDAHITLGTRVQCRNWFGRFYIAAIDRVHRGYVSPRMLISAAEHAQRQLHGVEGSTVLAF
jgi:hypothetical protein